MRAEIRISLLLQYLLAVYVAVCVIAFFLAERRELVNSTGLALIITLVATHCLALQYMPKGAMAQTLILVMFQSLFFLPRFLTYLVFPSPLLNYPFPQLFEASDFNFALIFVIAGSVSILSGFYLGTTIKRSTHSVQTERGRSVFGSRRGIILAWLIIFTVDAVYFFVLGVNAYDVSTQDVPGLWIIHLFSIDVIGGLIVALMVIDREFFKANRVLTIGMTTCYVAYMTALGSRGGLLRVIFFALAALIARDGDFKLRIKSLSLIIIFGLIGSGAIYTVGTTARYVRTGMELESSAKVLMSELILRDHGVKTNTFKMCASTDEGLSEQEALGGTIEACESWARFLAPMAARIGIIDYVVEILSDRGDLEILRKYMTVSYASKNVINNVVVGTPFPESTIMTNRILAMAFRGVDENEVRNYIQSDPWTAWGLAYTFGGFWLGLLILLIVSFLTQVAYQSLFISKEQVGKVLQSLFLFFITFGCLLMNFGLDHAVTFIAYTILSLGTTLVLIFIGDKSLSVEIGKTISRN